MVSFGKTSVLVKSLAKLAIKMVEMPQTESQYLAATVYPTLEIGIEQLLKAAFPEPSVTSHTTPEEPGPERPLRWLGEWLKKNNKIRY